MSERAASSGSSQSAHPSTALSGVNQTNGPSAASLALASGPSVTGASAGGNFASSAASVAPSSSSPRKVAVPVLVKDGKLL